MTRARIYISGPLSSSGNEIENIDVAVRMARRLIEAGFAPLCPHLSYHIDPGNTYSHDLWMDVDRPWVEAADAVLRLPGESLGADIETDHASTHGIPVFSTVAEVVEHFQQAAIAREAV